MPVLDLTHTLHENMPVYPGTEQPRLTVGTTIEQDGFAEKLLTMYSHTGTHMDAPAHLIAGGTGLDGYPVTQFMGPAMVIDARGVGEVSPAMLMAHAERIRQADFVLLHTGWASLWGQPGYFEGFPVLTVEAAQWLAGQGLKGFGVDAISVDPVATTAYPVHMALLGAGMVLIENLKGLELLPQEAFALTCLPLKLQDADGSPVRAVAVWR